MNRERLRNEQVALPTSKIRSPGAHLIHTTTQAKSSFSQELIQAKLSQFNEKVREKDSPMNQFSSHMRRRSCLTPKSGNQISSFMSFHNISELMGPGQLKTVAEEIQDVLHLASQILSAYNLELSIRSENKQSSEVYNILKWLIPEICNFNEGFFKKLKIYNLIIYDDSKENGAESVPESGCIAIPMDSKNTQEKIHHQFYKIILNHMVVLKPEISKEWLELDMRDSVESTNMTYSRVGGSLEDTFKALMKNKNYMVQKEQTNKLRDLLVKYYPEDLSEEWFNKKKDVKKQQFLQVQFNLKNLEDLSS